MLSQHYVRYTPELLTKSRTSDSLSQLLLKGSFHGASLMSFVYCALSWWYRPPTVHAACPPCRLLFLWSVNIWTIQRWVGENRSEPSPLSTPSM